MSDRVFRWSVLLGFPLMVTLIIWAFVFVFQERGRRIEACEQAGAEAVAVGNGRYLCVLPDGRIVKP